MVGWRFTVPSCPTCRSRVIVMFTGRPVRALAMAARPNRQSALAGRIAINAGIGLIIVSFLAFFEETGCP